MSPARPHLLRRLAVGLALAAASLFAAEVGLRALAWALPGWGPLAKLVPPQLYDSVRGHRLNPGFFDHDRGGFRNPTRPEWSRIVALGDSHTYGLGGPRSDAWPPRLAAQTGVPVYNMGVPGYGPPQLYSLAKQVAGLRPEVVVVGLYLGNDLADAWRLVHEERRWPELACRPTAEVPGLAAARRALPELAGPWKQTFSRVHPAGAFRQELARRLWLYALLRAAKRAVKGPPRFDWDRTRALAEAAPASLMVAVEHGPVRTVLTPLGRRATLDLADPRVDEGRCVTLASLRGLAAEVAPAKVLVTLMPTKERVVAGWLATQGLPVSDEVGALVRAEDAAVAALTRDLGDAGLAVVDARPALSATLAGGVLPYSSDSDGHPNPAGYEAVARLLAPLVRARLRP